MAKYLVKVDLSLNQYCDLGSTIGKMWYHYPSLSSVMEGVSGCPHSGGSHTLYIRNTPENILIWLDLFEETFERKFEDLNIVREKLNTNIRNINLRLLLGELHRYAEGQRI